jgi:6-phosphofructokinase 1
MGTIKCIGILTSGGDAPGMNAAIRAVTRAAIYNGLQVKGIYRGYKGLVTGEIKEFKSQNVSNIIQLGGTILKTARCKEFTTPEGRQIAYDNMKKEGIDALVVIGGDGSLSGARIFAQEFDVPCIGLPGTIDNDLYGTDTTIGYDTALNTILDAVDKIRDTATSHERLFFVEVMGRDAGFLALNGAIASGAEAAIIPEFSTEVDQLEEFIKNGFRKSKNSSIVLVAESELTGGAMHYAERVKNEYPQYDVRVTFTAARLSKALLLYSDILFSQRSLTPIRLYKPVTASIFSAGSKSVTVIQCFNCAACSLSACSKAFINI